MKAKYVVADTAAFVRNVPFWEYGEEIMSVREVIAEIRDRQTRQRVEALPIVITMRQPQLHSIRFVNEFSKKTGDYASLSHTDIKVLALTYELELEARGGSGHLQTEPQKVVTEGAPMRYNPNKLSCVKEDTSPLEQEEGEESCPEDTRPQIQTQEEHEGNQSQKHEGDQSQEHEDEQSQEHEGDQSDECESDTEDHDGLDYVREDDEQENCDGEVSGAGSNDEDDGDGWITPSNLKRHKLKSGLCPDEDEEEEEDVLVACMTADFAIQNVLKHIGLSVMGVDGKIIKRIKTFILRCHACFKTTSVMTKMFCHHCGNKTLKKVSITFNPDGSQRIWINTKRPISKRGMKYSLPTPKGGKHHRNPLLVADQREAKHFSSKMSKKKISPLDQDYNPDQLPFAVRDVYSRASQFGYIGGREHHHYYWEKRNPNERSRRTGKKKK